MFWTLRGRSGALRSALLPTRTMTVEITGKAAHAGMAPEKGISAIVAASRAIAKMKLGRIDEETTANIGVISGGKARNIVADHVTVTAEARSRNQEKLAAQLEHMVGVFESEAAAMGAKAVVKSEREYQHLPVGRERRSC